MSTPDIERSKDHIPELSKQFATFFIDDRLYGIDVMEVQEVTQALTPTAIRLAPTDVKGLINLRGQIVTAIGLRELFGLTRATKQVESQASVVCRIEGNLVALLVDRIGDVVEARPSDFEATPSTIDPKLGKFMAGVYKTSGPILSVLKIESISSELNSKR